MGALPVALLCTALLLATTCGQTVTFSVSIVLPPGDPSRVAFVRDYGVTYAREILQNASGKVWEVLHICHPESDHTSVKLVIQGPFPDGRIAQANGDNIEVDMSIILSYDDCARSFFEATIYHEMTHLWRGVAWSPDDPMYERLNGLNEGIAEYVVMAGTDFYNPACEYWTPSVGDSWYAGYCMTAQFFRYLTPRQPTLVGDINGELILYGYRNTLFPTLLGDTPENLWAEFANNFTPYVPGEHPGSRSDGIIPARKSLCRAP